IKWDHDLENYRERGIEKQFDENRIVRAYKRPFVKLWLYFDQHFNGRTYQLLRIFPAKHQNQAIWFKVGHGWPFFALAVNEVPNLLPQSGTQVLPLYRYDKRGDRLDNITDWVLTQFRTHYDMPQISKENIFHY